MSAFQDNYLLLRNRKDLLTELVSRDITQRFSGQAIGAAWAILHPLIIMLVYIIVFGWIFKARMPGNGNTQVDYIAYLLSGLIPWLYIQEAAVKSTTTILSNQALVKQIVFPVELLPLTTTISAFLNAFVAFAVLAGYRMYYGLGIPPTFALLPALVLMLFLLAVGLSYLFSAATVYFRDLKDIIPVFFSIGVYLVPVLYLPEWVPGVLKPVVMYNPFTHVVVVFQDALAYGKILHPASWLWFAGLSITSFMIGYHCFKNSKSMFGSAL